MIALLVVAMVCGTVLVLGHRSLVAFTAKWDAERRLWLDDRTCQDADRRKDRDIESRRVSVLEREVAIKERHVAERPASEPMPLDLHNRITGWEEQHAQDDERATLVQLYAELGDWDKVRSKLPAIKADVSEPWAPV